MGWQELEAQTPLSVFLNVASCYEQPPSQRGQGRASTARDVLVKRNFRALSGDLQPQNRTSVVPRSV